MLGSSDYGAQLAAHLGLPFSFADFFGNTSSYGPRMAELYREMFQPSEYLEEPKVNVGLQVICAPTEEEAKFVGASRSINKVISALGLTTGGLLPPGRSHRLAPGRTRPRLHGTVHQQLHRRRPRTGKGRHPSRRRALPDARTSAS